LSGQRNKFAIILAKESYPNMGHAYAVVLEKKEEVIVYHVMDGVNHGQWQYNCLRDEIEYLHELLVDIKNFVAGIQLYKYTFDGKNALHMDTYLQNLLHLV